MASDDVSRTFRALVEDADRKFARVRDVPAYGRISDSHYFHKVFKVYMRLWKYQQENRARLVEVGLQRWEIGEIASRIGQLYFGQYMRTSEARFLVEAYVFYEAILNRGYFEGSKGSGKDLGVRFKELRFYARFLLVSLITGRSEMVKLLMERLRALVGYCKINFRETNFKEWQLVVQEIVRFMKVDTALMNVRPLRYCAAFGSHPTSLSYVTRFHAKKMLKFHDALIASYHRNEVKFAEITLDSFRMLQCLEWEPSGSFYQKRPFKSVENGGPLDHSLTSGLIDINLAMDMIDPTLPPNPKKAILYRPSVTQLIAVMAMMCEELPPDCVMLIYISASGKAGYGYDSQLDGSGVLRRYSKRVVSQSSNEKNSSSPEVHADIKGDSHHYVEDEYIWLGPRGNGGSNNLYPGDIIPFTRRPIFLIIDSDNSHAFKVFHGVERGEKAALLLSPLIPSFRDPSSVDTQSGSQFTFFLTAPVQAFLQLVGLPFSETDMELYSEAENLLSTAFAEWEVILCTSSSLDLVWAQILSDPFIRRLILRFICCRSVLSLFCPPEDREHHLPLCLPPLPSSVSAHSASVQSFVLQLANLLAVAHCFPYQETKLNII